MFDLDGASAPTASGVPAATKTIPYQLAKVPENQWEIFMCCFLVFVLEMPKDVFPLNHAPLDKIPSALLRS